jgi:hypothetical protein
MRSSAAAYSEAATHCPVAIANTRWVAARVGIAARGVDGKASAVKTVPCALQPSFPQSRRGNLMLLDEKRPVSTSPWSRPPKVPEVPGQDEGPSGLSHRHHHRVPQIEPRGLVSLEQLKGTTMLRVRRAIEDMRAIEQRVREDQCTTRVPPGAQYEVDFDVDRPGDDDSPTERREEAYGEVVPPPLPPIARGDERSRVADDQPASRDSTSSTRSERSGSSSTTPAYGSSAGTCSTSSATSAENEVPLRLASRSSRLANDEGIEMVRRTAFMGRV